MSTINEVKARLDIVETVSGYVPALRKSGRTFKAPCPFHSERTPSFIVDPGRGTWHCFGACSTGGDVIEFVRRIEGLDFPEALRRCAQRAGVELRPPTARERRERDAHERLLQANDAAAIFYQSHLLGPGGAEALRYIESRGIDAATRQAWQLGYAPGGWTPLLDHLTARGFSEADLVAAGLAVEGDGGRVYDRFRHRLVFPTRDARSRLIGFGARALDPDDEPKYLNTPQTPLFDKSATVYGLDRASDAARRADRIIVVEGYMDVIAAHQFGLENAVASMGTAITGRQMALLKRSTHNVVLALDADVAGAEATLRAVEVAAESADRRASPTVDWSGLVSYQDVLQADIRVVTLPAGEDPDSLIRKDAEAFRTLIDAARPVVDHLFESTAGRFDLSEARERSRALEVLAPSVAAIADPVVRAHYVQRLARMAGIDERAVLALLARRQGRRPAPVPSPGELRGVHRGAPIPRATVLDGESRLLQLLLLREESAAVRAELDPDLFEDSANRRLFEAWRDLGAELVDAADSLDEDTVARHHELAATRPDWLDPLVLEARQVADLATSWAAGLRRQRTAQRLQPAARELAGELARARRRETQAAPDSNGYELGVEDTIIPGTGQNAWADPIEETETDSTRSVEEVALDLAGITARQRQLANEFRQRHKNRSNEAKQSNEDAERQPATAGGHSLEPEEAARDADI